MKVFLRNTLNGSYHQGPSKWTPSQLEALNLDQSARAMEKVFQEHLEDVEILLCYDNPQFDVLLPVERPKTSEASRLN